MQALSNPTTPVAARHSLQKHIDLPITLLSSPLTHELSLAVDPHPLPLPPRQAFVAALTQQAVLAPLVQHYAKKDIIEREVAKLATDGSEIRESLKQAVEEQYLAENKAMPKIFYEQPLPPNPL